MTSTTTYIPLPDGSRRRVGRGRYPTEFVAAVHEAAAAVLARFSGGYCERLELREGGGGRFRVCLPDRGFLPTGAAAMCHLSGPAAEKILTGEPAPADVRAADWKAAAATGLEPSLLRYLATKAERILREHWHEVTALATRLYTDGRIGREDIIQITEQARARKTL
jgi:hypothetical protein